ncbi:MAG: tetraacyldisaccharide 4'-kinase [Planctomycetota bacterium]
MPAAERSPRRVEDRLATRGGAVELLRAPALLFGVVARARGWLYARRWMTVLAVDTPVISVGNLVAGGTGKTPFVAWLVERLAARGVRAGILSRGYRPRSSRAGAAERGPNDEARMLAELLPHVPHVEDKDRVRGAQALEGQRVDVIVLDDGFQHRRLARDLDLVLVDATRPFGLAPPPGDPAAPPVRALLPRGLMREPATALRRAHALVITRSDAVGAGALDALERELSELAPGVPIARAVHAPAGLRCIVGAERGGPDPSLSWLRGRAVDLVSGIGNPAAFERTVRELGADVCEQRRFPDHHRFTAADLAGLGARPVLVTAKDAARCAGQAPSPWPAAAPGLQVFALDVALRVTHGEDALERLLDGLPESDVRRQRSALHEGLHG